MADNGAQCPDGDVDMTKDDPQAKNMPAVANSAHAKLHDHYKQTGQHSSQNPTK